jgi:hypothetical protein
MVVSYAASASHQSTTTLFLSRKTLAMHSSHLMSVATPIFEDCQLTSEAIGETGILVGVLDIVIQYGYSEKRQESYQ